MRIRFWHLSLVLLLSACARTKEPPAPAEASYH
jgi:hypothetical protein